MTRYRVVHRTSYRYSTFMTASHTLTVLEPRSSDGQVTEATVVVVDPVPEVQISHVDEFGNTLVYLSVVEPHDHLVITATHEVDVAPLPTWPTAERDERSWEDVVALLAQANATGADGLRTAGDDDALEVLRLCYPSPLVPAVAGVADYAAPSFPPGRGLAAAAADLCHRIATDFRFDNTFTEVSTPIDVVLQHRRGVCQDFAHLAIACLRSQGLAARYISGYLETDPPPGKPKLVGTDASHAWCAVWSPDHGWLEIDPTNDQSPPQRHVVVAWGRDYGDVAPVSGVVFGPPASQKLTVEVDVARLD